MSREATLILVGVLVAVSPFSGLPRAWLAFIMPFLGLVAGGIGYAMRHEHVKAMRAAEAAASGAADGAHLSPYASVESNFHMPSRVS